MRKVLFILSAIVHALCIALLTRISIPLKIEFLPARATVIDISLAETEAIPQPPLMVPDFSARGKIDSAHLFPGSGVGGGSAPASWMGKTLAGDSQTTASLFSLNRRLKPKPASSSEFSLVLPVSKPAVAYAFPSDFKILKGLQPAEYGAGTYPGGIQFDETAATAGKQHGSIPFSLQIKEAALWTQNILSRIERNWVIPTTARVGLTGQVEITLTVDHRGNQLSLVVAKSSSQESLDQAALNAMKASLPFPPLPENIDARVYVFHFVFAYNA
jgi:TonB family protein